MAKTTKQSDKAREQWLNEAAELLGERIEKATGTAVPKTRISFGFPTGRGSAKAQSKTIGICHYVTSDRVPAIFITPELTEPSRILDVLAHELLHAAFPGAGHKGDFRRGALAIGLAGKMTATVASEELRAELVQMAEELGELDHASVSRGGRKQSTRMLKLECDSCGMIIRTTAKWLGESGAPFCGCGGDFHQS